MCSKKDFTFQISILIVFLLSCYSCPNICWYYQQFCIFSLFLTHVKVKCVLLLLVIFCWRKKFTKESVLNVARKINRSYSTHLKCRLCHSASLLWAKKKFIQKDKKLLMTMPALDADENIETEENCYRKSLNYYWKSCWRLCHVGSVRLEESKPKKTR